MRPPAAVQYVIYSVLRGPGDAGDLAWPDPFMGESDYFRRNGVIDLGRIPGAVTVTSLCPGICVIFRDGPQKQMIRIYAGADVTLVAHAHPHGDLAAEYLPRHPMSHDAVYFAISSLQEVVGPKPTSAERVELDSLDELVWIAHEALRSPLPEGYA